MEQVSLEWSRSFFQCFQASPLRFFLRFLVDLLLVWWHAWFEMHCCNSNPSNLTVSSSWIVHISFSQTWGVCRNRKSIFIVSSYEVLPINTDQYSFCTLIRTNVNFHISKRNMILTAIPLHLFYFSGSTYCKKIIYSYRWTEVLRHFYQEYHWENPTVLHHVKRGSIWLPEAYEMIFLLSGEMYCAPLNARALSTFIGMKSIEYAFWKPSRIAIIVMFAAFLSDSYLCKRVICTE